MREVILVVSVSVLGTTIDKSYKRGRRCVKSEKDYNLPVMWVDTPESIIQDESDKLTKQKIFRCAKLAMSEVETQCKYQVLGIF